MLIQSFRIVWLLMKTNWIFHQNSVCNCSITTHLLWRKKLEKNKKRIKRIRKNWKEYYICKYYLYKYDTAVTNLILFFQSWYEFSYVILVYNAWFFNLELRKNKLWDKWGRLSLTNARFFFKWYLFARFSITLPERFLVVIFAKVVSCFERLFFSFVTFT